MEVGEGRGNGGPGSRAVYKLRCAEDAGGCLDLDGIVGGTSGEDGRVGAQVDGAGGYGPEKCGGELARVEAVLVEDDEMVVAGAKCGNEAGELCSGVFAACAGGTGREG